MMGENLSELGQQYDNPGNWLDYAFKSPAWGEIKALGIDDHGEITPISQQPIDISIIFTPINEETERYNLYTELYDDRPKSDPEWYKRLVSVLGRQAQIWHGEVDLDDLLTAMLDNANKLPNQKDPKWSLEAEKLWMERIVADADNSFYDDEYYRNLNPARYAEWKRNRF